MSDPLELVVLRRRIAQGAYRPGAERVAAAVLARASRRERRFRPTRPPDPVPRPGRPSAA